MAQYDGTIRINTKIDSGGFLKGLQKMSSQSKRLNNSISETTNQIDRLKKEINDLQNAPMESNSIRKLKSDIDSVENKLDSLYEKRGMLENDTASMFGGVGSKMIPDQSFLDSLMKNNPEWKKLTADIEKAELSLQKYENRLKQAQATEQKKTDNQIAKKSVQLEKACNKLDVYKTKLSEINGSESGIAKKLSNISSIAKKGFGNLTKSASKSNNTLNKLSGTVSRFTKRVWGVLSSALVFSVLTKAFTALREKMAAAVKQNAQFSASMKQISGNLNNVFNNLLSAAMPALNTIMSAIAKATSYLNAFVSLLTGKTIKSSNAAADAANDQASAVGGVGEAAKKASEYLNGYDEMNVQSSKDSSSGGGGGGTGSGITYEDTDVDGQVADFLDRINKAWENADFTEFGQIVGNKINESLESIDWEKNKENGYKLGKSFATFLNGIFETPDLFTNVGSTISESLNTAINTALGFSENFHWDSAGQAIADGINGFFNTFDWKKSANTVNSIALGVLEMIRTAIQKVTWESIGADIHDFLATIEWFNILNDIGGLIVDGVCAGIDFLSGLTGLDWPVISAAVATVIGTKLGGLSVGLKVGLVVLVATAAYKLGEGVYEKLTGEEAIGGLKDLLDMDVTLSEIGQAISDGAIVDITLTPLLRWMSGDDSITTEEVIDAGEQMISDVVDGIKGAKDVAIDFVYDIAVKIEDIKAKAKEKWEDAKGWFSDKKFEIAVAIDDIKTKVSNKWTEAKNWWGEKKLSVATAVSDIKEKASAKWTEAKKWWGEKKLSVSTSVGDIIGKVKKAWSTTKTWWSKNVKLKIPELKFRVTYSTPSGTLQKAVVKALRLSGWPKLSFFANGGFPDMGQLFIARERGAEMVGNIGGKTAVATNDQITSAIAAAVGPAVYDAVMSAMANSDLGNGDISVYVGGQKITDYVIKDVKNRTISSGGINPLLI